MSSGCRITEYTIWPLLAISSLSSPPPWPTLIRSSYAEFLGNLTVSRAHPSALRQHSLSPAPFGVTVSTDYGAFTAVINFDLDSTLPSGCIHLSVGWLHSASKSLPGCIVTALDSKIHLKIPTETLLILVHQCRPMRVHHCSPMQGHQNSFRPRHCRRKRLNHQELIVLLELEAALHELQELLQQLVASFLSRKCV